MLFVLFFEIWLTTRGSTSGRPRVEGTCENIDNGGVASEVRRGRHTDARPGLFGGESVHSVDPHKQRLQRLRTRGRFKGCFSSSGSPRGVGGQWRCEGGVVDSPTGGAGGGVEERSGEFGGKGERAWGTAEGERERGEEGGKVWSAGESRGPVGGQDELPHAVHPAGIRRAGGGAEIVGQPPIGIPPPPSSLAQALLS